MTLLKRSSQPNVSIHIWVEQLTALLVKKRDLFRKCELLTKEILQRLEDLDDGHCLTLLKRRSTIFHQLRQIDREIEKIPNPQDLHERSPRIPKLLAEIQQSVENLTESDQQNLTTAEAIQKQISEELSKMRHSKKLINLYKKSEKRKFNQIDLDQ